MTLFYFLLSLAAFICGVILVLNLCSIAAQSDRKIKRMIQKQHKVSGPEMFLHKSRRKSEMDGVE